MPSQGSQGAGVAVVGLGLWPRPLIDAAEQAAADLLPAPVSARR